MFHDAPRHSGQDERGAHIVGAVRMSPEKLDLTRFLYIYYISALQCVMTAKYLHNVGSYHLKAPDDLILCRRYELEGQQNENHANKTDEPLACAKQPGGHHPVTEERRRSAIILVLGDVPPKASTRSPVRIVRHKHSYQGCWEPSHCTPGQGE